MFSEFGNHYLSITCIFFQICFQDNLTKMQITLELEVYCLDSR